ncbi:MAG: hypothetical protein KJN97_10290 [Deltaproteobacteria bacterium]|nr:hypothetical protein [Deltaproteobacteria bacterium]
MKKFAIILSVVLSVWVLGPTPQAHASWWGDVSSYVNSWWDDVVSWLRGSPIQPRIKPSTSSPSVPELDPSAAGGAIVLVLGGVAYIASRRRDEDLV